MPSSVVGPKSEAGLGARVKAARNCFSFSVLAVAGNKVSMQAWQYLAVSIMMNSLEVGKELQIVELPMKKRFCSISFDAYTDSPLLMPAFRWPSLGAHPVLGWA
jgi:hypothetical protein